MATEHQNSIEPPCPLSPSESDAIHTMASASYELSNLSVSHTESGVSTLEEQPKTTQTSTSSHQTERTKGHAQMTGQLPPVSPPDRTQPGNRIKSTRITMGLLAALLAVSAICYNAIVFPLRTYSNTWGKSGQEYCGIFFASASSLAAPDMTFGNLTITEAKVIDASWNLVMGRGLQGVILVISCRVCLSALQWITESTPVSFELFETMALDPFSLTATIPIIKGYSHTVGWRARSTLLFFLFSALFIIALPTMNDLQTGYIQISNAYAQAPNGTLLNLNDPDLEVQCDPYPPHLCLVADMPIVCVPQKGYQWGFSSIWVSIVLCLLSVWALGMYGIWIDSTRRSILHRKGRKLGRYRAIADLGGAIEHELGPHSNEYSNTQLKISLKTAKPIGYSTKHDSAQEVDYVILSSEVSGLTSSLMKDNET